MLSSSNAIQLKNWVYIIHIYNKAKILCKVPILKGFLLFVFYLNFIPIYKTCFKMLKKC